MSLKVDILGSEWTIEERSAKEDKLLENCDGYTDWTARLIVVERELDGTLLHMDKYVKKVLRHEIIHAYLLEAGLAECSGETDAWAQNEAMVDWFARMLPKIMKTCSFADAL